MRPLQYKGFFHCSSSIVKERGPIGAYQGIIPTIVRNGPANAAWYGVYETARTYQTQPGQSKNDLAQWRVVLAGGLGGWAYWLSIYPIDVVKSTVQADEPDPTKRKYQNTMHAIRQIHAQYGIKGFFRGFTPCMLRAFPANGATFMTYQYVMNKIK